MQEAATPPAPETPYAANNHSSYVQDYPFQFTGKGSEYFAIWIVNLLLSIITLGIYSAWAKVRREKYFHRNTLLDDKPFDYTGDPVKILIGRLIALFVIAVGSTLQNLSVALSLVVLGVYAVIYPWVIVRSLRFRARNTRYRNTAFNFTGTTWQAAKVYFWIYLALLPLVAVSIYYGAELTDYQTQAQEVEGLEDIPGFMYSVFGGVGLTMLLFVALFPAYLTYKQGFVHSNLRFGNAQGGFDAKVSDFFVALLKVSGVAVLAIVAIGLLIGVAGLLNASWLGLVAVAFWFAPAAAFQSNIINTTYNHALVGEQRFVSTTTFMSYLGLLLVNMLLLAVTFGLAWPWVQVRIARYRCEHLALRSSEAAFAKITAEAQENQSAIGEEVAEFLDFDISL
jgi:uncharacterized membrane protein YjgN (DUF898 family)